MVRCRVKARVFHGFKLWFSQTFLNQLKLPRYWGALQEAWDGPALVAFCDGEYMGALEMAWCWLEVKGWTKRGMLSDTFW